MVVKPVVLDQWRDELEQVQDRLGELFVRPEPRRQAGLHLEALLSSAERRNGWQLAEQIGDARPWRTHAVLSQALWSQDKARALCRSHVVEQLGAPDGVLVVDETGFLKKGTRSVGVARPQGSPHFLLQYSYRRFDKRTACAWITFIPGKPRIFAE